MGWKPTWGDGGNATGWTFEPGYEAPWDTAATFAAIPEAYKAQALERITRNYWGADANQILQQIEAAGVPRETALEKLYQAYRTNPATANSGLSPAEIKQLAGVQETPESIAQNRGWISNDAAMKSQDNDSALSALLNSGYLRVAGLPFAVGGIQSGLASLAGEAGPLTYSADTGALPGGVTTTSVADGLGESLPSDFATSLEGDYGGGLETLGEGAVTGGGGTLMPPAIGMTPDELSAAGLSQTGPGSWTNSDTLLKSVFGGAAAGAAGSAVGGLINSMQPKNTFDGAASGAASGAAGGAAGALAKLLSGGDMSAQDWISLAGTVGSTGLGLYGANQQADTLKEIAKAQREAEAGRFDAILKRSDEATARGIEAQQFGRSVGAPSRTRFEGSFAPGFTMANDPGYTDALDQSAKATLHGLSVAGNPAGSPNAWAASLADLYGKTAYPALQNYRSTNAATGGYGSFAGSGAGSPGFTNVGTGSPAAGADTLGLASAADRSMYSTLASGLGTLTSQAQPTLAELLRQLKGTGGSNIFGMA